MVGWVDQRSISHSKRENESTKNEEESTTIFSIFLFSFFLFLSLAFLSCRLPAVPVAAEAAGLLEWLFISGMKKKTTSTVAFLCKQLQLHGCINNKKKEN
jgi:hypothetical protein